MNQRIEADVREAGSLMYDVMNVAEFVAYNSDDGRDTSGATTSALRLINIACDQVHTKLTAIERALMNIESNETSKDGRDD